MANLNMDFTGNNPNCLESGRLFRIYTNPQTLEFDTPVYADSLHIYYASGGLSGQELSLNTDYIIQSTDIDQTAMSDARLTEDGFDKTLIKSVTFTHAEEEEFTISVTYQRLYPSQVRSAYYSSERLDLTPELLNDMVQSIENLKVRTSKISDVTELSNTNGIVYDLDATCTNNNNIVTNEAHIVNVSSGNSCILPKAGSFYYDSVKVTYPATGATLVLNKDYVILGMDESATKATKYTSPVYKYIVILASINGAVNINYHAFGGIPTIDNYRDLIAKLQNIVTYINSAQTLTEKNLGTANVITSIIDRVGSLETQMRRLQGTPAYGDISSGKSILMKLFSEEQGLHWYSIATLHKIVGTSITSCTADTFTFRLQSQLSHFQFTASVAVDLHNTEGNCVKVDVLNDNYPLGFIPFKDYSEVAKIIRPQIRVIWNNDSNATGAILQLGFTLTNMLEETVAVEDLSGRESCWKLVDEIAAATTPQDSEITLPDEVSVWSDMTPAISKVESQLIPFSRGTLAWNGELSLNRPVDGWQAHTTDSTLLESNIDISKLSKIRLDLEEVDGLTFGVDIPLATGSDHQIGRCSFAYANEPAYINIEVFKNTDGNITFKLSYDITSGVSSNELKLRDIVVF